MKFLFHLEGFCDAHIQQNYLEEGNKERRDCPKDVGSICKISKIDGKGYVVFKCETTDTANAHGTWTLYTGKF